MNEYEKETSLTLRGIPIHVCEKAPKDIIHLHPSLKITKCPYCDESFKKNVNILIRPNDRI
jgi:NAD-dependent SIR2 family protein deacetylase